MSEESGLSRVLFAWLQTKVGAGMCTLAVLSGGAIAAFLQETLLPDTLLLIVEVQAGILILVVWSGAASATRLKAKISKLRVENSSLRNPPSIDNQERLSAQEEKILLFLIDREEASTEEIANHLGVLKERAWVYLIDLREKRHIYPRTHEDKSVGWYINYEGTRYLVRFGFIE